MFVNWVGSNSKYYVPIIVKSEGQHLHHEDVCLQNRFSWFFHMLLFHFIKFYKTIKILTPNLVLELLHTKSIYHSYREYLAQFDNRIKPRVCVKHITRSTINEKTPFCSQELA